MSSSIANNEVKAAEYEVSVAAMKLKLIKPTALTPLGSSAATCQPESITWISSVWVTLPWGYLTSGKQNKDQHGLNLERSQTSTLSMLSLRGILGQIEECDVERTLHKSIRMCVCCYQEVLFNVEFDLFPGWQQISTHLTLHTNHPAIFRVGVKQKDAKNNRMNFLP